MNYFATFGERMSRIGRLPIIIPSGVTVEVNNSEVAVHGPEGQLRRSFHPDISIALKDNIIVVSRPSDERRHRALHGLTRALLANMVEGVSKGFEKKLEIVGVGYRVQKTGNKLTLQLGFSQPVGIAPPDGISFAVEGTNRIKVIGVDKELVGDTAAKIRAIRPPDAYKGFGIRYAGEKVRLKSGKAGKAIGKKK